MLLSILPAEIKNELLPYFSVIARDEEAVSDCTTGIFPSVPGKAHPAANKSSGARKIKKFLYII
jgi:hypothetical protein